MQRLKLLLATASAQNICLGVFFAVATFAINWDVFDEFWRSPIIISGTDGTSHAVVGEYYAKYIFPKTWGWIPHWFSGMPFPQFYPPLFYFLTAFVYHLLSLPYAFSIKATLTALTVVLPGLSSWVARVHTRNIIAALSTGYFTIIALSYDAPASSFGIAIRGTFRSGLFTHLLGFVCLLLWCHFFLQVEQSRRARYLSVLFLFCTLLSNVHVIPVAALFFVVTLTFRGARFLRNFEIGQFSRWAYTYILLGLLPLFGAAFWYVPLFTHFDYLTTMTLPSMQPVPLLKMWLVPLGLTCLALLLSTRRKETSMQIISVVSILTLLASTIDSDRYFPSLPIQPFRYLASFNFLSCMLGGYVIGNLASRLSKRPLEPLAWMILIVPILLGFYTNKSMLFSHSGFYLNHEQYSTLPLSLPQMTKKAGIANVEVHDPYFVLDALLAKEGSDTTYSVFRESAISSIFMTPLRNSFSREKEAWGIDTFLAFDPEFQSQDFNRHLDRAGYMGVSQFFVISSEMINMFTANPRVSLEKAFGNWRLFALKEPAIRAQVLKYEPAVFFGPVSFKKRSTWSYDYTRFQEELFFHGNFDTLLARASDMFLDTSKDLDRFHTAIITDYQYRDLERAYMRLKKYSENNLLVCISSNDPLFHRLSALSDSHRIFLIERLQGDVEDLSPLRQQFKSVFTLLSENKKPVLESRNQIIRDVRLSNDKIHVSLTEQTEEMLPILIKVSYFPSWQRINAKEPVYMVTPTFMLTYAKTGFTLAFVQDESVKVGLLISLLTVLVIAGKQGLAMTLRFRKRFE